jgi:hypothetical protein
MDRVGPASATKNRVMLCRLHAVRKPTFARSIANNNNKNNSRYDHGHGYSEDHRLPPRRYGMERADETLISLQVDACS